LATIPSVESLFGFCDDWEEELLCLQSLAVVLQH